MCEAKSNTFQFYEDEKNIQNIFEINFEYFNIHENVQKKLV